MNIHKNDTAVVFIDPQNEVLSDKGLAWALVGDSVRENRTVERVTHEVCDHHNDVATASLIEVWIDESERRTCFWRR